jgi:hypothetical protein
MIDALALTSYKTRYTFTSADEFKLMRNEPSKGMQIYWGEILARAHLTAVTAILRSRHWISAVSAAAQDKHLLAFAAALRGFIESAADASTTLASIPLTLARDHIQISRALSGELRQTNLMATEIEHELIHFAYARSLTKTERVSAPASHRARKVRDYLDILEKGHVNEILECYRTLCDLTHPGASSVWMWLHPINELEVDLAPNQDESVISQFLAEYRKTFLELLMFAFNPAIVTLSVLNCFSIERFHVPALVSWICQVFRCGENVRATLRTVRVPICAELFPLGAPHYGHFNRR